MPEKDEVRHVLMMALIVLAAIAVVDFVASAYFGLDPRTGTTLAMLDLAISAFFAFALYQMARRQAEANETLTRLAQKQGEDAGALFELRHATGEFRPPEALRAAGAEVGVAFEVLNKGLRDSAVDRAWLAAEAPDGSWERVELTRLERTSGGAAEDLMVRGGDRARFLARVRLSADFPPAGCVLHLVVEPVAGREGRLELRA